MFPLFIFFSILSLIFINRHALIKKPVKIVDYCDFKLQNVNRYIWFNSLSATGDRGRQPPLLPPLLGAPRVDTIIHNYRLSAPS